MKTQNINTDFIEKYSHYLASKTNREFEFKASSPAELNQWQQNLRQRLIEMLGILEIEKNYSGALNPEMLSEETLSGYIRQEWTITTEDSFKLPFYMLIPKGLKSSAPLILTPHGHSKNGKEAYAGIWQSEDERNEIIENQRDIALQAVKQGYIAIAPDMRGLASLRLAQDVLQYDKSCSKMHMRALMFGRTLLGERVWDVQRLIDFALTQKIVDSEKIAITGNSGGGTVSLFAAACDQRIKLAAPSCYFNTFEDSIGSIHHCDCNYIPGILKVAEMYEVAGLISPRPFLAVAGKFDLIFPFDSAQYAYDKLKKIYEVANAAELCRLYVGNCGHRYCKEPVWQFIKEFFGDR